MKRPSQQPADQPVMKKKKIVIRQRTVAETEEAADQPPSDRQNPAKEPSVDLVSLVKFATT